MKRWSCLFITILCLWGMLPVEAAKYEELSVDAKACIVIDATTGRILGGHNIHEQLPMASTTKIMTALLTLEEGNLDEWFTVDSDAIRIEGSSMGLIEGDRATLRSLLYGMLLPSGNDAANAAAVRICGSPADFVLKMNRKAAELGLEHTQFQNPSGLDAEGHYSTAYDMACLCREAMKEDLFREICCLSKAQVCFGNPPYDRWLQNYNKLLTQYSHCIGVKTGFTEAAYRCLVSAAEKDGITLICVTLNCADDWAVHEELYEYYYKQLSAYPLKESIPTCFPLANRSEEVSLSWNTRETIAVLPDENWEVQIYRQPLLFSPLSEGSVLGEAVFYLDGEEQYRISLLAAENILDFTQEKTPSLIDRMMEFVIQLL